MDCRVLLHFCGPLLHLEHKYELIICLTLRCLFIAKALGLVTLRLINTEHYINFQAGQWAKFMSTKLLISEFSPLACLKIYISKALYLFIMM